ncbi:single-stranded DNA-binding protein [Carboxylicivirga mesophila]|uniref:Single-stranded DNA-binding protein n=2 Tax=Carboxylicivirga TaxID=1628153 RepID=A0A941F304_9BACT|nr:MULTISPECIES: single-stranded DNA-binding protein [Carboxylicivirga]MBR8534820.1 single-stranded DNA-binding protein [Carboxylicivirga sediminis]MBS2210557.1 single-stranded DNA-binding protein [Carboxylicivirga mesophila]
MSVNKVILVGNVGKDPEVRYLDNDVAVANFSLATTERGYTGRDGQTVPDRTEWHNIVAWRGLAKVVENFVKKGTQLFIEGKIRTRSYDDKDGNKRYVTEIYADNLQLLGRKSDNPATGEQGGGMASSSQPTQPSAPMNTPAQEDTFLGNDETDDLPF